MKIDKHIVYTVVFIALVLIIILSYYNYLGTLSTILGILIGASITRYFTTIDKRERYIQNAQNVLLIASKQYNEFENIKRHFEQFQGIIEHSLTRPLIVSETEWRLSKSEILGLNQGDPYIQQIIYELVFIDKSHKDLILAIDDHKRSIDANNKEEAKKI